jgi:hypothetical protein
MTTDAENAGLAKKQAYVKIGVAIGMALTIAILAGGYVLTPATSFETAGDRVVYALRVLPLSAMVLMAGIGAVASSRYASDAINPLAGAERGSMLVHQRYLENTLQQLALHVLAVLGLAADGGAVGMRLIPGLVACFVVGRLVFWIGYLRDPMHRGPGFTMTFQPTAWTLLYLVVRIAWRAFAA